MEEAFLHYLWKYRLFRNLSTVTGEPVEVIHPGTHNTDAGPDFFNARIRIGNTLWAGNAEIHLRTSDFFKHHHQHDKNYSNLILHAVYENDMDTSMPAPVVVLKEKFPSQVYRQYCHLSGSRAWIPCHSLLSSVNKLIIDKWLERMLAERLSEKAMHIRQTLSGEVMNREEMFYRLLASVFGFKLNTLPFEMLARSLPLKVLARHKNSLLQLEAILLGQAGLLGDKPADAYHARLIREYRMISKKFGLNPMDASLWKFARTRPSNFPTLRLAQFAELIHKSSHLLSKIIELSEVRQLITLFECEASSYWQEHYHFGKKSGLKRPKALGRSSLENILINAVAPMLFLLGCEQMREELKEKALSLLYYLPAEKNNIIRQWEKSGIAARHAADSQALLQLKKYYCNRFKCLECGIGTSILNTSVKNETTDRAD
jgi:hypothetical protein